MHTFTRARKPAQLLDSNTCMTLSTILPTVRLAPVRPRQLFTAHNVQHAALLPAQTSYTISDKSSWFLVFDIPSQIPSAVTDSPPCLKHVDWLLTSCGQTLRGMPARRGRGWSSLVPHTPCCLQSSPGMHTLRGTGMGKGVKDD